MSPVTLPPSLTPRLHFGSGDSSASAAGKESTSSSSTSPASTVDSTPSPASTTAPEKKEAPVALPPKSRWQRFQDWRKQRAEAKRQAALAAGANPKKMTRLNLGLLIASSAILGALGVKGCDSAMNVWGKKTDPTHQVDSHGDPHATAPHASDPHHPPVGTGGGTHDPHAVSDPHHPPVAAGHVGSGHGAPATGVTAPPASAAALRPTEGKILGFYFQSAELCENALAKNRTKLIAGVREYGQLFEPKLGLGDITQVEAGLKKAKEAMAASGVTYDLVTKNAAPPSAAQAKAFREYIVAANKARVLLEQGSPAMMFLPSGITATPDPATQLHQDLVSLIESSGFEDAYMELLSKLGKGTAGYRSPWGLTLENMAQDVKRQQWP